MQNWSNLHKIHFRSTYDGIPIIEPAKYKKIKLWIGFNEVLRFKGDKSTTGVHFFKDDYQFERVYNAPKKWCNILKDFGAVLSPDFSLYTDFPLPIQKYNHFRRHWCGALWQKYGITVYPTISWGDKASFSWCFDGEPAGAVIATSNLGCTKNKEYREGFLLGYNEMIKRLHPSKIIMFGNDMEELDGNIVEVVKIGAGFMNMG